MKKKIGIEKLLQWAFNEELCKGQPIGADAWAAIERFGLLGCRVDTGHHGTSGHGFIDGTPHPDAQAVARVIAELPKQMTLPPDFEVRALFGSFGAALPEPPEGATLLCTARFNAVALVIKHATFKNRPVWDLGEPELGATIGSNGHPLVYGVTRESRASRPQFKASRSDVSIETWTAPDDAGLAVIRAHPKRGGYDLEAIPRCPIAWETPAPFEYAEARAEYAVWREALADLRAKLLPQSLCDGTFVAKLLAHELTEEFPPLRPWDEPAVPSAPVRESAREVSHEPLPMQPHRAPARAPLRYELPKTGESRRKLTAADIG